MGMKRTEYAPMDMQKSGKWIRFLCMVRELTVKEICNMLGVCCSQSVYAWFNGKTMPSLDNLYGLSRILNSPIDELVLGTEENLPKGFQARKSKRELRLVKYYYLILM